MPDPTADPLVYLLGSSSAYHRTAGAAGSAISRNRFRHHTFQLVISSQNEEEETAAHDSPAVDIEICLANTDLVSDPASESWSKLGALTAAAPILQLGYAVLRNVRAKRTGASVWGIKVIMASANDRPDE